MSFTSGRSPGWTAAAICILVSLVLMAPGIFGTATLSGDSPVHIRWQWQFAEQFWSATPYPRWLPDMNNGFGSPAFFFYPPLIQWVGSLFAPLAPGAANATLRTALALWALSAAGGIGTWYWMRALRLTATAALIGALVYLLVPYRCYFDIYQRGALPELAGISVMPWLLCFAQRLKNGSPGAWGGYALSVGLILYSHLPAAEMGILFSTCYVLALTDRSDWFRFLLRAGTATVAGFMVGALCISTALGLLRFIPDPANMWGERQQPMNWLLFAAKPWVDSGVHTVVVALCLLALPMVAFLGALTWRVQPPASRRIALFLSGSVIVVLILNTEPSRFFWALQTPLSRIQFPFRLLSLHVLAFSGLAGLALDHFERSADARARLARALLWLFAGGLLLADVALFGLHARYGRDHPPVNAAIVAETRDTGEYVIGSLEQVDARFGSAPIWSDQPVTASLLRKETRFLAIEVEAVRPARLALRQFAFSGWRCRIDGGAWQPSVTLPQPLNVPVCSVPAGRHRLEADLPATAVERFGLIATLLGLALALANIAGIPRRFRRRAGSAQNAAAAT